MINRKKTYRILGSALLFWAGTFNATAQLAIGGWQTHFAYNNISKLVETPEKVYALSSGNLFSVDKQYHSLETYSKLNGLTDGLIGNFDFDPTTKSLVICYENLNIDIVKDGKTYRLTDIATKEISGKIINNITFADGKMYLSCGFGIVEVNLTKKEIANTYIIGPDATNVNVLQVQFSNDSIYALTDGKLYMANKNDRALSNYTHWKTQDLPDSGAKDLKIHNNIINYFGDKWHVRSNEGSWSESGYNSYLPTLSKATLSNGKMVVISPATSTGSYGTICALNTDYTVDTVITHTNLKDAISIGSDIWLAEDSLVVIDKESGLTVNRFCPEGPSSNNVTFFRYDDGRLVSGYGKAWNEAANIQTFDGEKWQTTNSQNFGSDDATDLQRFRAIWDARFDPKDPRRLYASTWYGLFEFYDNQFVARYTDAETSLSKLSTTSSMITAEKITFDEEGNMWITHSQAGNSLHYRDSDGGWHALSVSSINAMTRSTDVIITNKSELKIVAAEILSGTQPGICFIKSGTQPYYVNSQRTFSTFPISDGSTVSPSRIYCVTEDNNGEVWVGTDIGPIVFRNVANVFSNNYTATRIKLTRKDDATLADYLLATEQINDIAVDGANRKWIATANSGLYLISADGLKTIHHFTTENSPLTTNSIFKLGINDEDGMVYIQTSNGLFSYKSDAAAGKKDLNNVHVYPNPVRPDYSGTITITGLMEDTEVRITDVQGHVVSHGLSNGSIYTWDGHLADGRRASTGIYLVFQATTDGNNDNVAKFAIIKR